MKLKQGLSLRAGLLVFLLVFMSGYLLLGYLAGYTFVRIDISNSHSSNFNLYWNTSQNHAWSEVNSATVYVNNRKRHHVLVLPVAAEQIYELRIDPTNRQGVKSFIHKISIYSVNHAPESFENHQDFALLQANDEIGKLKYRKNGLLITATGNDPYLVGEISVDQKYPVFFSRVLPSIILGLAGLVLFIIMPGLSRELRFVPGAMLLVFGLIVVMATLTRENAHPDEVTHLKVANYYRSHLAPPVVCSGESLDTYSVYGVSRLNNREIAYYLGGRYLQLVDFIPGNEYSKLRYLNVAMFFVLVLMTFFKPVFRYIALPLLLTPQAWYVFSYYNSDALSLFVVCLLAAQLFDGGSLLRKTLRGVKVTGGMGVILFLTLLFALQFWVKLNFVFYHIFLLLLAFSWLLLNRRLPGPGSILLISVSIMLGISMFLGWEVWRHGVNDFQLSVKSAQCQELTAGTMYKPSTRPEKTHPTLRLRDKGVSLMEMIEQHNWTKRIFYTGLGAYGYTQYLSIDRHYEIVSLCIVLLFTYIALAVIIKGGGFGFLSVACALVAMLALVAAAAVNSWVYDLQAQGRYLLVFLPILGTLLAMHRNKLNTLVLTLLTLIPLVLALISFVGIGLVELPRA